MSALNVEQLGGDMARVSTLINSIMRLTQILSNDDLSSIEALCAKAGFLADRCAISLGHIPTRGSLEEWAEVELPEAAEMEGGAA
ncbi:MAG: hypothetical protein PHQ05_13245 [Sterolibacterium sp.]|nr:hypothetical protein [Sterolibacterium sp.]